MGRKRLFKFTVELTTCIAAEDEAAAGRVAEKVFESEPTFDLGAVIFRGCAEVKSEGELPQNWNGDCLPYGCGEDEATVAELLAKAGLDMAKPAVSSVIKPSQTVTTESASMNAADFGADSIREVHDHPANRLDLKCPKCGMENSCCNCNFCQGRGDPDIPCPKCGREMVGSGPGYGPLKGGAP